MAEPSGHEASWQSVEPESEITSGFRPSDGGDFRLRSSDEVEFTVHSVILSVASTFFKDLMSAGSGERVVDLTEDAQTIRLVLDFLYHHTLPAINDLDTFINALEVSRKYDLESMTAWLRSLFWLENSPLHMRKQPLKIYQVASAYEFRDVAEACFDHCIRQLDIQNEKAMNLFISTSRYPEAALALVARLARRWQVLASTLSHLHEFPMNLRAEEWDKTHLDRSSLAVLLICDKCRPAYDEVYFSAVSWQSFWAYHVLDALSSRPLSECDHLFKVGSLCKPSYMEEDTVTFCEKCFEQIQLRAHKTWEDWAKIVRDQLELRSRGNKRK